MAHSSPLLDDYAPDTQIDQGYDFDMGTVNAPEKGLIGRRLRYVLFIAVLASAVTKLIQFLHAHGLLK
ncbi:hypothetical protein SBA1_1380006 [Candidatus Sulfotelmatobacter kueseliae]|uniref:Uncharacterized protein n=1 Tax=Candidatus Sulfotelmatobacter kueseliae TaxID=2042962 RepID=A0A2U3K6A8_9BACT|nr:hypothetical protein SBA1_1380006 [Candidatus Sulfotelmatobacter kueseliae]